MFLHQQVKLYHPIMERVKGVAKHVRPNIVLLLDLARKYPGR